VHRQRRFDVAFGQFDREASGALHATVRSRDLHDVRGELGTRPLASCYCGIGRLLGLLDRR
tara:strand:+ start:1022 stop:1204 length:183 start_codon:yes stop_codon:yes gene_type:complete